MDPTAPPVTYGDRTYREVREGKAVILAPEGATIGSSDKAAAESTQQVFYNPIQQFNRDLTVLAIKAYGEDFFQAKSERNKSQRAKTNKKKRKREGGEGELDPGHAAKKADTVEPDEPIVAPAAQVTEEEATEAAAVQQTHPEEAAAAPAETTSKPQIAPKFTILDALSATGLRALRYAHEIPFVTSVTANDLTASAVDSIKLNIQHNQLEAKIRATNEDALAHMYRVVVDELGKRVGTNESKESGRYNVVDLDPYGTAAPFFDAALQSVKTGGLLCVTCTDASIWAGHGYCEKSYTLYGAVPIKGMHSHEAGLRIILHALASAAARHSLVIEPLLSLSIDFYGRVFVRVKKSQAAAKFLASKTMVVYTCDHGCGTWELQYMMRTKLTAGKKPGSHFYKHQTAQGPSTNANCRFCGSKMHLGGPMYGGHIHEASFIQRILDSLPQCDKAVYGTTDRVEGMLRTALEELQEPLPAVDAEGANNADAAEQQLATVDPVPFFVVPSKLAGTLNATTPNEDMFRGALRHLGYSALRSHCRPGSVKTDAPWEDIWWIMREWIRQVAPVKAQNLNAQHLAWKILGEDVINGTCKAEEEKEDKRRSLVFNSELARLGRDKADKKVVRYQLNPKPNWGPMTRATGK